MKPYDTLIEHGFATFPEQGSSSLHRSKWMPAFGSTLKQSTMLPSFSRSSSATPELACFQTFLYEEHSPTALTPPFPQASQYGNSPPYLIVTSTCASDSVSTPHRKSSSATPDMTWLRTCSSEECSPTSLTPPFPPGDKYGHFPSYLNIASKCASDSAYASDSASTPHTPHVSRGQCVNLSSVCMKLQQLIDDSFQEENQQTPMSDATSETRETVKVGSSAT